MLEFLVWETKCKWVPLTEVWVGVGGAESVQRLCPATSAGILQLKRDLESPQMGSICTRGAG